MSDPITVPLTQGKIALIDVEDAPNVLPFKWHAVRPSFRYPDVYYASRWTTDKESTKRIRLYLHRVLMDCPPGIEVDHIDGNTLDCRRHNMRHATKLQNNCNRSSHADARSKYKGVSFINGVYRVVIAFSGAQRVVGEFNDEIEAALAYDDAAREVHGEFARLNFPGAETVSHNVAASGMI